MANNQLTAQKPKFSMVIGSDKMQRLINQTLGDKKKAERYTAAIMSAVATNPQLSKCEAVSIITGSLLAESLGLPHSPQLGRYYLVPFNDKKTNTTKAQFILGYKGYIELAMKTGFYRKIIVLPVKQGEFVRFDPFTEEYAFQYIEDFSERDKAKTIGYYAMFEYLNGFKKVIYWTKDQMIKYADKYSPAFSAKATSGKNPKVSFADYEAGRYDKSDAWLYSSYWYQDFDGMGCKTMIRQLLSKWGMMSSELQQAYVADGKEIETHENGAFTVIDIEETESESTPATEPQTVETTAEQINIDEL